MAKNIFTKFRWFWAWQDEKEEAWLGKMSKQGYHLSSINFPGFYSFGKGEPREYIYRLDYQTFRKKDRQEYLQLFKDAGWEYLGEMGHGNISVKKPCWESLAKFLLIVNPRSGNTRE
jgi:hypothetical protein